SAIRNLRSYDFGFRISDCRFGLHLQKRLGVRPLSKLTLEVPALVHQDLSIVGKHDADALEGARRRAFEVDARDAEPAAVARALELVLRRQIVRRASQVRAGDAERVEAGGVLLDVLGGPHEPDAELFLPSLVDADAVFVRETGLELLRRLVEHVRE